MTVKHTPGPWIVKKNIDGIYAGTMSLVATESSGEIVGPRQLRYQAVGCVEANARLIAAAPDLLEALSKLTEMYCQMVHSGDCGNWNPEDDIEIQEARAAIAKATGKGT